MALDIADDFELWDNAEEVTYQRRAVAGGDPVEYQNVEALKRATTGAMVGSGQTQMTADTARWHIRASTLAVAPRRGDRIVSTTHGTWEILSDDVAAFASRYACTCRKVS